jgi:NAD(P)-dependent dehydrogenase (short-subunit alcohol dehydrogenase family)
MIKSMEGKVALVTGSGSGIGRATAPVFAREGAKVVIADINVEAGQETADRIKKDGGAAIISQADVTQSSQVEKLINSIIEVYGRLDCACNNAAIPELRVPLKGKRD